MPAPQPDRQNFLIYLRAEFPYQMDYLTLQDEMVQYARIIEGLCKLRADDPWLYRTLWLHTHTRLPRTYMVDLACFDTSTIKRHLSIAADQVAAGAGFVLAHANQRLKVTPREIVFARNHFLVYLRDEYKLGKDYLDLRGEPLDRDCITYGLKKIQDNDSGHSRIVFYHMNSDYTKTEVARLLDADPSTIKRRLNYAADLIMQRSRHSPLLDPEDGAPVLFQKAA